MSMESAIAFCERVEKDAELQKKLKEFEMKEGVDEYVRELGYDFTREEVRKAVLERNPELTDEQLEGVNAASQRPGDPIDNDGPINQPLPYRSLWPDPSAWPY